jgi:uncharacterized repeat protein (TIGR04076 family)
MKKENETLDDGYTVTAEVISQKGECAAGHTAGDRVVFDGMNIDGPLCIHALYSLLPKVFALRYGAGFPWLEDPDTATHACPDAENPVVFRVSRGRKK